jgi:hypothetical protein
MGGVNGVDAHLKIGRIVKEAEDRFAAGAAMPMRWMRSVGIISIT